MTQFQDESSTALKADGIVPKKISHMSTHFLIIGKHRLKYFTEVSRDKDFEKQLKNATNYGSKEV